MKLSLSIVLLLISFQFGYAQQTTAISGQVTENGSNLPLPGVSILIKGTKTGTVSNSEGQYKLSLPAGQQTLIFSFLGFESKELHVNGSSTLNVSLSTAANALNEVVVIAYGTAKRSNYAGSVSQIKSEQLDNRQVSNISSALQGLAPGVQSVSSSGQPGTTASIRIRGIGSINASSDPLYVVDGNPFSGDINSINVNDIASVSILKDAASSALYGSRGANGVIIVTTKS
eukprot:gene19527-23214_t